MIQPLRVLVVEDSENDAVLLKYALRRAGYEVTSSVVDRPDAMRVGLESQDWDLITSDHSMPHFSAPEAMAIRNELRPEVPFIIVSGEIDLNLAVSLMREGAQDYIQKSELVRLGPTIERELRKTELRRERLQAELKLNASQNRLQEVLENSLDAFYKRNLLTNAYDYTGPAFATLTGFNQDEMGCLTIETMLSLTHPADVTEVRRVFQGSMTGEPGTAFHVEYRFKHKDGQFRWLLDRFTVLRDSNGHPLARIGSVHDVTQRKQAEEALRESEQKYRTLFETSMDGILLTTPDGKIYAANPAACQMLGRTEPEIIQAGRSGIMDTSDPRLQAALEERSRTGNFKGELIFIRKDGAPFPVDLTSAISEDTGMEEPKSNIIFRDITHRKQAEEGLRQSQEHLRVIFETLAEGVALNEIVFDAAGKMVDYRILEVNDAYYRVADFRQDNTAIGNLATKLYGMDLETIQYFWEHHQNQVDTVHTEFVSPLNQRIYQISTSPFKNNRFITSFQDVTERKQAEAQVRQLNLDLEQRVADRTAQLTAANQELEAFSYSVSHDLRAPLRSLDGFSAILLEDYGGQLEEDGRHYLECIRESSHRMNVLIDDLLSLSRVTQAEFSRQQVDLRALIHGIAAELKAESPLRQVEFEVSGNLIVQGDRNLLKIALENLLNNAFKFTARCKQAAIQVGVLEQDGKPVYFVRDNGAGFEMENAGKLFGTFQRLHSEKEFPGTGIGLTIVQRIVQRHGGRVWAEGAVDQGATFYFTLG